MASTLIISALLVLAQEQDPVTATGHTSWARCVAFNADGSMLASGGNDSTLRVWDPDTGEELQKYKTGT